MISLFPVFTSDGVKNPQEAVVWVSVVILADDVKVDEAVLVVVVVVEVDDSKLQLLDWQHEYE